ncbi:MAG: hypothetical protein RR415_06120 [Ruthenibacterium sp.]
MSNITLGIFVVISFVTLVFFSACLALYVVEKRKELHLSEIKAAGGKNAEN